MSRRKDRMITIQRYTATTNGFGEEVKTWVDHVSAWAERTPISDGERWRGGEIAASLSERFKVYWSAAMSGVTPKDRISYNGLTYDISGVKEIGRRQEIEITAGARND